MTTRVTTVKGHHFKTEGRVLTNPSWLAIYGRDESKEDDTLVAVAADEKVKTDQVEVVGLATRPPARYSEATLLSAMEGAGKLLDDELKEAMSGKGLGTPATRATIIEGLLGEKYMVREGRELIPTAKAFQLLTLLRGLGVEELTSPELTGNWETKLAQMERGELKRDAFMRDIAQMTQIIVKRAKEYNADTIPGDYATLKTPCPNCGSVMKENYRRFTCTKCEFSMSKTPGGRTFEVAEVEDLLKNRETPLLTGFRSKRGLPFAAILRIVEDKESPARFKMEFDFGQSNDNDEEVDFTGQTPVGPCIKCKGNVYDNGVSYICENATGLTKNCDFRSGKIILQQEISTEQMAKLLNTGRTDLLTSFKSARTGRMFKAYLVNNNGKTGFEFEAKVPKEGAATKTTKASKSKADDAAAPVKKTVAKKAVVKKTAAKKTVAKKAPKAE